MTNLPEPTTREEREAAKGHDLDWFFGDRLLADLDRAEEATAEQKRYVATLNDLLDESNARADRAEKERDEARALFRQQERHSQAAFEAFDKITQQRDRLRGALGEALDQLELFGMLKPAARAILNETREGE